MRKIETAIILALTIWIIGSVVEIAARPATSNREFSDWNIIVLLLEASK